MVKRVVVGVTARGYVDGRYIGEEKEANRGSDDRGRSRRGKAGGGVGPGGGKRRGAHADADNVGNSIGGKRRRGGQGKGQTQGQALGQPKGQGRGRNAAGRGGQGGTALPADGRPRAPGQPGARRGQPAGQGTGQAAGQGRNQKRGRRGGQEGQQALPGGTSALVNGVPRGQPRKPPRNNRGSKKTPFRAPPMSASPSEVTDFRRVGDEAKSGQFAEALASQANVKRERLHKVLAQSGHGSRRDMEIMIASGRVMVNGIVAMTGSQVSPGDNVLVDQRPVKLKFDEELPRILLYHKPEGEIVTTSDPGNRITVFDNLPPVENGKWVAIGRLDINTSGLLIFTTNGELANRLMHPRYEVEREYAVRILGELTDEQTQNLLTGVNIDADEESDEPTTPARFDTIDKRGGEGVNQWYHVTIKEGRNREVRKMFETQGLTVSRLIRVRFGKIELPPRLARGKLMELDVGQVNSVLGWVGMKGDVPPGQSQPNSRKPRREPRAGRGAADSSPMPDRGNALAPVERGNALGPMDELHEMDAADDIGNAIVADIALPLQFPPLPDQTGTQDHGGRRGRGGRGRGGERGRQPGGSPHPKDAYLAVPINEPFVASVTEADGNRVEGGNAHVPVAGKERKRNPKNRRRARRGPRSTVGRGPAPSGNSTPEDSSGNEG